MNDSDDKQRQRKIGWRFVLVGLGLPVATWGAAQACMAFLAALSPVSNQGAMVWAFLAFCASIVVGAGLVGLGLTLLLLSRKDQN